MMKITSETRSLDELRPHLRNYNQHGKPGVIDRMAGKIRKTAFTAPIIVNPDGIILGGHLRRLALLKLRSDNYSEPEGISPGWQVPVRVFRGTELEELAILAADNPDPSEIDFDNEGLASILSELAGVGELEGSGYTAARLDELIGSLTVTEEEPEAPPDFSDRISEKWMVVIDCEGEKQQQELLAEFSERGLPCRALIS